MKARARHERHPAGFTWVIRVHAREALVVLLESEDNAVARRNSIQRADETWGIFDLILRWCQPIGFVLHPQRVEILRLGRAEETIPFRRLVRIALPCVLLSPLAAAQQTFVSLEDVQHGVEDDSQDHGDDQDSNDEGEHHGHARPAAYRSFFRHGHILRSSLEQVQVDMQRPEPDGQEHEHDDGPHDDLDERGSTSRGAPSTICLYNASFVHGLFLL
jgi:hypothetical protein